MEVDFYTEIAKAFKGLGNNEEEKKYKQKAKNLKNLDNDSWETSQKTAPSTRIDIKNNMARYVWKTVRWHKPYTFRAYMSRKTMQNAETNHAWENILTSTRHFCFS